MKITTSDEDIVVHRNILTGEITYVLDPFNPLNKEVQRENITELFSNYGLEVQPRNMELYRRAFTHQSYTMRHFQRMNVSNLRTVEKPTNCLPLAERSNENLEYLGDGVLELATKLYLYKRFPAEEPGFKTEKKIALVNNENIGRIAMEMGLTRWLLLSKHVEKGRMRGNIKKAGCLFEAFLAAVFLDFNNSEEDQELSNYSEEKGFRIIQTLIERIFEKHVDWTELLIAEENYKNMLQTRFHREFKKAPIYLDMPSKNPVLRHVGVFLSVGNLENDREHYVSLEDFDSLSSLIEYIEEKGHALICFGKAMHRVRKKAEQNACKMAVERLAHM